MGGAIQNRNFRLFFVIGILITFNSEIMAESKYDLVRFTENKGQISDQYYHPRPDVLYAGQQGGLVFHLKQNGISYQLYYEKVSSKSCNNPYLPTSISDKLINHSLDCYRVDLTWINALKPSSILTEGTFSDVENFYLPSCPNGALSVKSAASVRYQNLYPGIDFKMYSTASKLKYDYMVAAGADYTKIKFHLDGALSILVNGKGELLVETPYGTIVEQAPLVIQKSRNLPAKWVVNGQEVSFLILDIDPSEAFVIDPMLKVWGTFYGGAWAETLNSCQVDANNNVYITGNTESPTTLNIATVGSHQTTFGGLGVGGILGDACIVKYGSNGVRKWSTYYGGSGSDFAKAIAFDLNGGVYFSGGTTSTVGIATAGAFQTTFAGGSNIGDGILVKLDTNGVRLWGTYYGGPGNDWTMGICVLPSGDVAVCGITYGGSLTELGSSGAFQSTAYTTGASNDGHIALFSPTGSRIWATYYAGGGSDHPYHCASDIYGNIYVTGATTTTDAAVFASSGAHQVTYGGGTNIGNGDAFLAKFDPLGTRLWSTYIGGVGEEYATMCKVDKFGNVYVTGVTTTSTGTSMASPLSYQPTFGGATSDVFLSKFNSSGQRLWSTYYGGNANEEGAYLDIDINSFVILAGHVNAGSAAALVSSCAYQMTYGGAGYDLFLSRFNSSGNRIWSSYFGGVGNEYSPIVACDLAANIYLAANATGNSASVVVTPNAQQTLYGGGTSDICLVKLNGCLPLAPTLSPTQVACHAQPNVITLTQTCGLNWYSDSLLTNLIFSGGSYTTGVLQTDTTFYVTDVSCGQASPKSALHLTLAPSPTVNIVSGNNSNFMCLGDSVQLTPTGAISYTWSNNSTSFYLRVSPSITTVYSVTGKLFNGCASKSNFTLNVDPCLSVFEAPFLSGCQLYPNPATSELNLELKHAGDISIHNELGQLVLFHSFEKAGVYVLNTSNLKGGVYVCVINGASFHLQKKLIIQP